MMRDDASTGWEFYGSSTSTFCFYFVKNKMVWASWPDLGGLRLVLVINNKKS